MRTLSSLKNVSRPEKGRKRVGRGPGSGIGKTSGRGMKGAGARSGYKRRFGREGGQFPLYMKSPERGFTRGRFEKKLFAFNLGLIDRLFEEGERIDENSLRSHGLIKGQCDGIKILGEGELTKKFAAIEVNQLSASARAKLEKAGISISLIECTQCSKG